MGGGGPEGDLAVRLIENHAGEQAAVAGGEFESEVFLADDSAGIDDAVEEKLPIRTIGMSEIGTEVISFAEQRVAWSARFLEEKAAGLRIALGGVEIVVEAAHLSEQFLRRATRNVAPMFFDDRGQGGVVMEGNKAKLIEAEIGGRNGLVIDCLKKDVGGRFAAEEKITQAASGWGKQLGVVTEQGLGESGRIELGYGIEECELDVDGCGCAGRSQQPEEKGGIGGSGEFAEQLDEFDFKWNGSLGIRGESDNLRMRFGQSDKSREAEESNISFVDLGRQKRTQQGVQGFRDFSWKGRRFGGAWVFEVGN